MSRKYADHQPPLDKADDSGKAANAVEVKIMSLDSGRASVNKISENSASNNGYRYFKAKAS